MFEKDSWKKFFNGIIDNNKYLNNWVK